MNTASTASSSTASLKLLIITQSIHSLTDDEKLKLTKELYLSMSDNHKSKFMKWPIVGFEAEEFHPYESYEDKCHRCHTENEITYNAVCWAVEKLETYKIRTYCKSCLRYFVNCVIELNCYEDYKYGIGCRFISDDEYYDSNFLEFYNCDNKDHKHLLRQVFRPLSLKQQ